MNFPFSRKTLGVGLGALAAAGGGAFLIKKLRGHKKKTSTVARMQQRLKKKQLKLQILKTDKKIFKEYLKL